jgi:hypothetical protein
MSQVFIGNVGAVASAPIGGRLLDGIWAFGQIMTVRGSFSAKKRVNRWVDIPRFRAPDLIPF